MDIISAASLDLSDKAKDGVNLSKVDIGKLISTSPYASVFIVIGPVAPNPLQSTSTKVGSFPEPCLITKF